MINIIFVPVRKEMGVLLCVCQTLLLQILFFLRIEFLYIKSPYKLLCESLMHLFAYTVGYPFNIVNILINVPFTAGSIRFTNVSVDVRFAASL